MLKRFHDFPWREILPYAALIVAVTVLSPFVRHPYATTSCHTEQQADCVNQQKCEEGTFWVRTGCDPVATFTALLALFSALLTVVSSVQIWFLIRTDKTARVAADAAKQSADAALSTERARIFIRIDGDNIAQRIGQICEAKEDGASIQEAPLRVEFRVINYGKTPALLESIFAAIRVKRWPNSEPEPFGEYWPVIQKFGQVIPGMGGEASQPETVRHVEIFGLEDAEKVIGENPENAVWFFGQIVYRDVFENRWHHRFLWRYDGFNGQFQPDEYEDYAKSK